jgi:N-acetylglucosamine-6-phosphate deacetylase
MVPPSPEAVAELLDAGHGVLRLVTLAPETDGALAAVSALVAAGVMVSVGHSDATASQVAAAAGAGARMVTHLFNAQRGMHHREPGVVGQALTDHRLTSGLIVDLCHVSAAACAIAFAAAPGRICLVPDAAASAGMPPGRYVLGGQPMELPPGGGAPVRPDGTLAGSALRMDQAVANAVAVGLHLAEASLVAGDRQADLIGRPDLGGWPRRAADLAGSAMICGLSGLGGERRSTAPEARRRWQARSIAVLHLAEAVAAASRIPADLIGRPDLGRLAPGAAADLAWLGDDLRTRAAWVGGAQVYGSR